MADGRISSSSKSNSLIHHPTNPKGGWNAAIFIIFVEFAERFAYQGLASNLIQYLTNVLNEPITQAAKDVNTWVGASSLFPLLGGFIADSYLGRFNTILFSSLIYLLGMIFLTLSVTALKHKFLFFLALYVLAIGDGGHKPCVQTFAADQFDEDTPEERDTKSSFFNWWYLGIVAGSTASGFVVIYLQDNVGWGVGLGVLSGVLDLAFTLFLLGIKRYRKEGPSGSPFTRLGQVFVAPPRSWGGQATHGHHNYCYDEDEEHHEPHNHLHVQPKIHTLLHTHQYRFLDKAAIIEEVRRKAVGCDRRLRFPVTQLDELERSLKWVAIFPRWLTHILSIQGQRNPQMGGRFHKGPQFSESSPSNHLQGALLGSPQNPPLCCAILRPCVVATSAESSTRAKPLGITVLQRIGVGPFFLSVLNMVVSAIVEAKRVGVAKEHGLIDYPKTGLPITLWWVLPQDMIPGMFEAFTIVGVQELFYDQMPHFLRSLGGAAYISIVGGGSFFGNLVIVFGETIPSRFGEKWLGDNINKAHFDYFYWVLAVLSAVNLGPYVWIFMLYVYKQVDEGHHHHPPADHPGFDPKYRAGV
uniref:Oligopeptide transporter-like protein n=1 Tax=Phaseolus vulgaris TaxID=3885 RepID=V5N935_PHAVU|nr:oligopeptide transporter-like protein [Phaseolus vulgaris]